MKTILILVFLTSLNVCFADENEKVYTLNLKNGCGNSQYKDLKEHAAAILSDIGSKDAEGPLAEKLYNACKDLMVQQEKEGKCDLNKEFRSGFKYPGATSSKDVVSPFKFISSKVNLPKYVIDNVDVTFKPTKCADLNSNTTFAVKNANGMTLNVRLKLK
jgi:hypothetical protein